MLETAPEKSIFCMGARYMYAYTYACMYRCTCWRLPPRSQYSAWGQGTCTHTHMHACIDAHVGDCPREVNILHGAGTCTHAHVHAYIDRPREVNILPHARHQNAMHVYMHHVCMHLRMLCICTCPCTCPMHAVRMPCMHTCIMYVCIYACCAYARVRVPAPCTPSECPCLRVPA